MAIAKTLDLWYNNWDKKTKEHKTNETWYRGASQRGKEHAL